MAEGTAQRGQRGWDQFGPEYDLPPFGGRARTYVIASTRRSGSHMLGHLMLATGRLGSPLEYLQPSNLGAWQERLGTDSPAATVRALMARRSSADGWFGVKAHWPHVEAALADPELVAALDVRDWVRIVRRDKVAQAVSLVIAGQTGAWISFVRARRRPEYDRDAVASALRSVHAADAAWDQFFAASSADPYVVVYEELLADPDAVLAGVCERLGVPAPTEPVRAATERQATDVNEEWRARFLAETGG